MSTVRETVYLALVERFLVDFVLQRLWPDCAVIDAILSVQEEVLKDELSEREAYDELLPWEERSVEEACQTLS